MINYTWWIFSACAICVCLSVHAAFHSNLLSNSVHTHFLCLGINASVDSFHFWLVRLQCLKHDICKILNAISGCVEIRNMWSFFMLYFDHIQSTLPQKNSERRAHQWPQQEKEKRKKCTRTSEHMTNIQICMHKMGNMNTSVSAIKCRNQSILKSNHFDEFPMKFQHSSHWAVRYIIRIRREVDGLCVLCNN